MFLALPARDGAPDKPLASDTINSLKIKFLEAHNLLEVTAHSTRGACATALLRKGVPPAVVQQMGDWASEVSFNFFYNSLRATQAWQQVLVPEAAGSSEAPSSVATSSNAVCTAATMPVPQLPA